MEVLSPLDKLFVVHVWKEGKHRERERWSTGGPLLRGLDVALANYRHTVVELEVCIVHTEGFLLAGQWSNTCCSTPGFGTAAGTLRLAADALSVLG